MSLYGFVWDNYRDILLRIRNSEPALFFEKRLDNVSVMYWIYSKEWYYNFLIQERFYLFTFFSLKILYLCALARKCWRFVFQPYLSLICLAACSLVHLSMTLLIVSDHKGNLFREIFYSFVARKGSLKSKCWHIQWKPC